MSTISWKNTQSAKQYLQTVQRFYEKEPVVQISVQLILSIFAVAFFTFAAIRPTLGTISTLLKKIDDQNAVNTKLDTKIQQLSQAQDELSKWSAQIPLISKAIPQDNELVGFVQRLEILANQSNMKISNVQFQALPIIGKKTSLTDDNKAKLAAAATTDLKMQAGSFITFSFLLKGDSAQILNFMMQLEKLDRVVMVTKLSVNKPENLAPGEPPLVASGKGTLYYLPTTNK